MPNNPNTARGSNGAQIGSREEGAKHGPPNARLGILEVERNRRPVDADHRAHDTGPACEHQRRGVALNS